jgi:nicotinate-nucleotide adenylyltransferase
MTIGLFFGSFNPIHIGHLIIANAILELGHLDQVWFVVSPQNPFKNKGNLLHEFDRLDMVRAAISDNPRMMASDVEFHMPKPSYTSDTLAYLSDKYPSYQFKLIVGEDNLAGFHKWKNAKNILNDYGLFVYPRPFSANTIPEIANHPNVKLVKAPMVDISATFIRDLIKNKRSIKYLVPSSVEELISSRKLYI